MAAKIHLECAKMIEYPPPECTCIQPDFPIDFASPAIIADNEDLEEIDTDELIEDQPVSHKKIWQEISDSFDEQRRQIEEYKQSKLTDCEKLLNPAVQFLENEIFPLLIPTLENTINNAIELDCLKHQKSAFNGIDFIAEMLWNLNPRHPERKDNWTYIFDMEWAVEWLEDHPRPYYPFSWIWSRDYAATRIQAAMRGYWDRSMCNIQEMRLFWKILAREREEGSLNKEEIECTKTTTVKIE